MRENVLIYGRYFGLSRHELRPRIEELLDFVPASERAGDKVELSRADERRLTIARSLVNDPDLLLLDEPTTASTRRRDTSSGTGSSASSNAARRSSSRRTTWTRRSKLCDRLVVMDHGKIVAEGSPWQLIQRYSTREVVEIRFERERPQNGKLDGIAERVEELPDRVLLYTRDGDATAAAIAERPAAAPRRSSGGARSRTSSSTSRAAR